MESWGSVRIEELAGKGRSVISCKPLKGGEIVLRDSPILLYSTSPLSPTPLHFYCDFCFRKLQLQHPQPSSCCSLHRFCSSHCHSSATHSPWLCHSLSLLSNSNLPSQLHVQARFLLSAYNLAVVSPDRFRTLMSLQSRPQLHPDFQFLHSLLPTPPFQHFEFSPLVTATLLSIDKLNSFGLMEATLSGERSVRAYGIYPNASFFNHDCLPNAARFDYVDSDAPNNTDIIVRMIHDVPMGREICLSYFPVNLNYSARHNTLLNDYGFLCECDRCKVEANWSETEEDEAEGEEDEAVQEEEEIMDEDEDEAMDVPNKEGDEFPHAYFFMRYMCDRPNCFGTLAPLPTSPSQFECNVCAHIKNDPLSGLC